MASPYRVERVRQLLRREISDIVMHLKDPRVRMVTVVDTEITKDLRQATIYVSLIGTPEQQNEAVQALEKALGFIRREVAQRIDLRFVPEFRVAYDPTIERAARVMALLDRLARE